MLINTIYLVYNNSIYNVIIIPTKYSLRTSSKETMYKGL